MKYKLEVDGNLATETLEIHGKEYNRTCKRKEYCREYSDDFADLLDAEDYNGDFIDSVYDVLDCSFYVTDVMDLLDEWNET